MVYIYTEITRDDSFSEKLTARTEEEAIKKAANRFDNLSEYDKKHTSEAYIIGYDMTADECDFSDSLFPQKFYYKIK